MKIFLSHSAKTADYANMLREKLSADGVDSLQANMAASGGNWSDTLRRDLEDADAMVFLVEPGADQDFGIRQEWSEAVEQSWQNESKPMVPVLIGEAEAPAFLKNRQAIRVSQDSDWAEAVGYLISNIKAAPSQTETSSQASLDKKKMRLEEVIQEISKLEPSQIDCEAAAKKLAEDVEQLRQRAPGSIDLANAQINLADKQKSLGRIEEASVEIKSAIDIFSKHAGAEKKLARAHMTLGRILEQQENNRNALFHLKSALDLYEKREGKDSFIAMALHANVALLHTKLGEKEEAENHWVVALSSFTRKAEKIPFIGSYLAKWFMKPEPTTTDSNNSKNGD